jgi:hypothetical protein
MSTLVDVLIGLSGSDWHTQRVGGLKHLRHVSLGTRDLSSSLLSVFATLDAILVFMLASKLLENDVALGMMSDSITVESIPI